MKKQSLDTRAKRRLAAETKRLHRDVPLFVAAGIQPLPTLDDARASVQRQDASVDAHFARIEAFQAEQWKKADAMRFAVAARVDSATLDALDKRLAALPDQSCYHADFWHRTLRDLDTPTEPTR